MKTQSLTQPLTVALMDPGMSDSMVVMKMCSYSFPNTRFIPMQFHYAAVATFWCLKVQAPQKNNCWHCLICLLVHYTAKLPNVHRQTMYVFLFLLLICNQKK